MRKKRVVITGPTGFVGSLLKERMATDFSVVELSNVLTSPEKAEDVIEEGDVVIHLACSTFPAISEQNRVMDAKVNIGGTLKLIEICEAKKVSDFVFLSSGGTVYGNGPESHKETDALSPKSSYGVIKVATEDYIKISGLKHVILRPSNIYGRKSIGKNQMLGSADVFLHRILKGEPIQIFGDGNNVRDYLYVADLLDFIFLSVKKEMDGVYNIGTGIGTTLNEIIHVIQNLSGKQAKVQYLGARQNDVQSNILDVGKAKMTGWAPKYTLEDGISEMLRSFESFGFTA